MTADTPITVVLPPELDTTPEQELPPESVADLKADPLVSRALEMITRLQGHRVNVTPGRLADMLLIDEDEAEETLSRIERAGLLPPCQEFCEFDNEPDPEAASWVAVVYRTGAGTRRPGRILAEWVGKGPAGLEEVYAELKKEGSEVLGHVETPARCTEFEVRCAAWKKLGVVVDGPVEDGGAHHIGHDPQMTSAALAYSTWPLLRVGPHGDKPTVQGICDATGLDRATVKEAVRWYRQFGQS